MYKIAVCLFGHLRTWESCFPSLKKFLLDRYDCDVFMHTWDKIDNSVKQTTKFNYQEFIAGDAKAILSRKPGIEYQFKDYIVEKQDESRYDKMGFYILDNMWEKNQPFSISSLKYLYYTMKSSNDLREKYEKEHDVKYDFVVFIRPDILLSADFEIENFIEDLSDAEIENSFFLTNTNYPHTRLNDIRKMGATDILFFAKPNVITDIFNNIDRLFDKFSDGMKIYRRTPESFFTETIKELGYTIWQIYYPQWLILRRANDSHFKKHLKKLRSLLKNMLSIPQELVAVIYYLIKRK